jgi:hypothetical protein
VRATPSLLNLGTSRSGELRLRRGGRLGPQLCQWLNLTRKYQCERGVSGLDSWAARRARPTGNFKLTATVAQSPLPPVPGDLKPGYRLRGRVGAVLSRGEGPPEPERRRDAGAIAPSRCHSASAVPACHWQPERVAACPPICQSRCGADCPASENAVVAVVVVVVLPPPTPEAAE